VLIKLKLFKYPLLILLAVIEMGHSWVDIEISDLEMKKSSKVKALVDTGASLTVLPEKLADELGIKAITEEKVSTGAGEIKVKRGRAWLKLKGKEDAFPVWISDFIDKVLLGVVVLESFGFDVDPTTGTLKERPLLLY
jgi:clan AA aspartic protease